MKSANVVSCIYLTTVYLDGSPMEAPLIKDDLSELRELNWPKLCFHKVIR